MKTPEKKWYQSFFTYIWVFNTGRGLSIMIRLPHNLGIMYDLGASEDFSPAEFIAKNICPHLTRYERYQVAQCIISHPHQDHITEIGKIISQEDNPLYPCLLTCPNDKTEKEKVDFVRLENESNRTILDSYRKAYQKRNPPLQTLAEKIKCNVPNVEYRLFYMRPPEVSAVHESSDHLYGNGMSMVLYLRHGKQTLLVPGDITPEVMEHVLQGDKTVESRYTSFDGEKANESGQQGVCSPSPEPLCELLKSRGLSILVAPHHGLESCFSEALLSGMKGDKPLLNVISEKRHLAESDGKVDSRYQSQDCAAGTKVNIDGKDDTCFSVSTRNGHHILIIFRGTDDLPRVVLRQKAEDLLDIT